MCVYCRCVLLFCQVQIIARGLKEEVENLFGLTQNVRAIILLFGFYAHIMRTTFNALTNAAPARSSRGLFQFKWVSQYLVPSLSKMN